MILFRDVMTAAGFTIAGEESQLWSVPAPYLIFHFRMLRIRILYFHTDWLTATEVTGAGILGSSLPAAYLLQAFYYH